MAARFASLFRGRDFEDLPEELRELLAYAQRDMTSMREMMTRMEAASRQLKEAGKPLQETQTTINDISRQLDELRARADAFDGLPTQFASLAQQSQDLASSQEKTSRTIDNASQQVNDLDQTVWRRPRAAETRGPTMGLQDCQSSTSPIISRPAGSKSPRFQRTRSKRLSPRR